MLWLLKQEIITGGGEGGGGGREQEKQQGRLAERKLCYRNLYTPKLSSLIVTKIKTKNKMDGFQCQIPFISLLWSRSRQAIIPARINVCLLRKVHHSLCFHRNTKATDSLLPNLIYHHGKDQLQCDYWNVPVSQFATQMSSLHNTVPLNIIIRATLLDQDERRFSILHSRQLDASRCSQADSMAIRLTS